VRSERGIRGGKSWNKKSRNVKRRKNNGVKLISRGVHLYCYQNRGGENSCRQKAQENPEKRSGVTTKKPRSLEGSGK